MNLLRRFEVLEVKMPSYKKDILINAPPEKVFEYVSDLPRHSEWATHRLKIEAASAEPIAVGARFKSVGHQMGMDSIDEITITEHVAPRRLAFESKNKEGRFRHVFELMPEGGGTRVSKAMEFVEVGLVTKLMTPVIMVLGPKLLATDLKRIKEHVE